MEGTFFYMHTISRIFYKAHKLIDLLIYLSISLMYQRSHIVNFSRFNDIYNEIFVDGVRTFWLFWKNMYSFVDVSVKYSSFSRQIDGGKR